VNARCAGEFILPDFAKRGLLALDQRSFNAELSLGILPREVLQPLNEFCSNFSIGVSELGKGQRSARFSSPRDIQELTKVGALFHGECCFSSIVVAPSFGAIR
jgi:hypothetical protein